MKRGLKIRNESAPLRCEICHQSDCLDFHTGECIRCRDIIIPEPLLTPLYEEEKPTGWVIPFGKAPMSRTITILLIIVFGMSIVGPLGVLFGVGISCFISGARRVLIGKKVTGYTKFDLVINLLLMNVGLVSCYLSGLYLWRIITQYRH
jgi:hypothetical protein